MWGLRFSATCLFVMWQQRPALRAQRRSLAIGVPGWRCEFVAARASLSWAVVNYITL